MKIKYLLIVFLFIFYNLLWLSNSLNAQSNSQKPPQTSQSDSSQQQDKSVKSITEKSQKIQWNISLAKIFWSIVIFSIALFLLKYLTRLLEAVAEKWANLRLTIKRLIPILRISGWTFVIYIIIAGILAPPIETLIAVTASAGIAVGFASQDILKNIFGGIMILFDRPFQVGDKIQVGSHYGEVVSIGLRTVRIVTPDDSLVSIPNSEIVNQSVSNSNSGESNCQVISEFYLPPDINIEKIKQIAYRAAAVSRFVYLNKPITVIFKNEIHQGRSLLKMRLKAYVLDIRYEFPFMSEMTETVIRELIKRNFISSEAQAVINGGISKG
jgi:small-conductance mechanosensitive channel